MMRIGVLGTGMIGATVAKLFVSARHEVMLANSRGPGSMTELLAALGPRACGGTTEEVTRWAEVILLAVPFRASGALPAPALVAGKIVIDAMNPYAEGGGMLDLGGRTSSEVTRERLPGARLVKAFNTIWFKHLASEGDTTKPVAERRAIFVAGDDAEANGVVAGLIEAIGFAPVMTGGLVDGGRRQQPGTAIYNRSISGREGAAVLAGGGA